jgi:hypothetical protein
MHNISFVFSRADLCTAVLVLFPMGKNLSLFGYIE